MQEIINYVIAGLLGGILSGLLGIGGGILLVPAFIYVFGMSAHLAQGTALAMMVPPVGILAAITYYNNGNVNLKAAMLACIGFFIGGLFGAKLANLLPEMALKRIFGAIMFFFSMKMIIGR